MLVSGKAAELAYLALVVEQPEASAARFENDFGLPRSSFRCGTSTIPVISVGATALALFGQGDPFVGASPQKGVQHLGHVAFAMHDIDVLLPRLAADGWRMIDLAGCPGGRRSKIGFVHPANFGGGLLMHFVEPEVDGGYGTRHG